MTLEVKCPYLPLNHYTAKGGTIEEIVRDLVEHWYQNHRNDPREKLPTTDLADDAVE
ncbi:MAG: hypothetical protein M3285_07865 [Actinomycetota bacterium]|nr:hypothetical protein [Actinomycetota bacterium]